VSLIGRAGKHAIRAISSFRDLTFTTDGNDISIWKRMELVHQLKGHVSPIYLLLQFGMFASMFYHSLSLSLSKLNTYIHGTPFLTYIRFFSFI